MRKGVSKYPRKNILKAYMTTPSSARKLAKTLGVPEWAIHDAYREAGRPPRFFPRVDGCGTLVEQPTPSYRPRCEPCWREHQRRKGRLYRQYTEPVEGCLDCGLDIRSLQARKGVGAKRKYCDECTALRARENQRRHSRLNIAKRVENYRSNPIIRQQIRADAVRKYGMSWADWEAEFVYQGGRCRICWRTNTERSDLFAHLDVDHCHASGLWRGLPCRKCNRGLGCFEDNIEFMKRAIYEYLTVAS